MSLFEHTAIEKVKKYWDERPCNIRHSLAPVGTKQYFDEVEQRKYFVEPHIPEFAEFEKWKGKKVLEIGCGIGTDTINFARAGAFVTAVELSATSLEIAKQRAKVFGLEDRIKFYVADAEQLSDVVPIEPYDVIYSFGVIHHTPHPEKAVEQMKLYTRPGSAVKIMVYHKKSWKVFWILLVYGKCAFWKLGKLIARYSEAQTGCPITYTYTKKEAGELLNPFTVTRISADHIFPYKISEYVRYTYVKVWYFRYLPKPIFAWLEKQFGWHLLVTATA